MQLIIVESPTKAKTITKFLGDDFIVRSSFGHIRDLPKNELGVDLEHNFEPTYVIPTKARKNVTALKKDAAKVDGVLLATDPDREGEAIAWHLQEALGLQKLSKEKKGYHVRRIVFHEIAKKAIEDAVAHPRHLDINLVDAQQARRVMDRLVGYKLSPVLWKRFYRGLSAGRVQSVAVRIIVEREREIEAFKPQEYWSITALLETDTHQPIEAQLVRAKGKPVDKLDITNEQSAQDILKDLTDAEWKVAHVEKTETTRSPNAPFTTSTLQQTAAKKLHFSSKQTMALAQRLYEAGYITYMRTDSVNLSEESLAKASHYIRDSLGTQYAQQRRYKTKSKSAQEAHEAVRPTEPTRTPDQLTAELDPRQAKLYDLIWRRFIASQMAPALMDTVAIDVDASEYGFRATGTTMRFDGFLKIYPTAFEEHELPVVTDGQKLNLTELKPEQHFTKPPARFNEASLIKLLEKEGIGRPSTYAAIISTIQDRGYVEKDRSRYFHPTETGTMVNDYLVEHFPTIVNTEFTSRMEEELDDIARGKISWTATLHEFFDPLGDGIQAKMKEAQAVKESEIETTDKTCDKCGSPMVVKRGRFGKFIACSNFPTCKNILKEDKPKIEPQKTGEKCDKCEAGELVIRVGRFGKFIACSNFPKCKNTRKIKKEADDSSAPPEPDSNNSSNDSHGIT